MKEIGKIAMVAILIILVTSCQQNNKIKVGFLIPASLESRWPKDQKYLEAAAKEQNIEVITRSAENDENLQLKQAHELLNMDIDVLIVIPVNTYTSAGIVRDAHDKGVPVLGYDRLIKNSELDYLITFDGEKIGNLMLDHAFEKYPKGNYVLLWGDPNDVNAVEIKNTQEKTLQPFIDNGDINIIYKCYIDDWSTENAYHVMKRILNLSGERIDAVITSYDGLAMGVMKAINEVPELSIKVITGQDAELPAIREIANGNMSFTIYIPIKTLAEASLKVAAKMARHEKVTNFQTSTYNGRKDVPTFLLEPIGVDKNTIRQTVIKDGFYTEEEIYINHSNELASN